MKHHRLALSVMALCGLLFTHPLVQALEAAPTPASNEKEIEAKEAEQEDAAQAAREAELHRPVCVYIVGTLELKAEAQRDSKGVVGVLHAKDQDYQLKIHYPELIDRLAKFDGKRVKLRGNPRNKGKYFLTQDAGTPNPTDK